MVPDPEVKTEVHKTGHTVLDLFIAGTALFISLCSLGLAIHEGRAMDRLVEASSTPLLEFSRGDVDPRQPGEVRRALYAQVENPGTGIARIVWFSVTLDGHEVRDLRAAVKLMRAGAVSQGEVSSGIQAGQIVISDIGSSYLKPESSIMLGVWPRTPDNAALFDLIDKQWLGPRFRYRACYCSIFNQCWVVDTKGQSPWPEEVRSCKASRPVQPAGPG